MKRTYAEHLSKYLRVGEAYKAISRPSHAAVPMSKEKEEEKKLGLLFNSTDFNTFDLRMSFIGFSQSLKQKRSCDANDRTFFFLGGRGRGGINFHWCNLLIRVVSMVIVRSV